MSYGPGWKSARDEALERDGFKCCECGSINDLRVHHKKLSALGGGNSPENLITLCKKCHAKAHESVGKAIIAANISDSTSFRLRHYLITTMGSTRFMGAFLEEVIRKELDARENIKGNANSAPCQ